PKTFTGLAAGSYTVKVVDANGCFDTDVIEVGQPTAVADTLAKAYASCNAGVDGSVTATFSGGTPKAGAKYELILNNVSQGDFASPKTFTGLAAGSYTVKVVDANGCFDTDVIEVGQPTAVADTLAKADASCNAGVDGSVTATFSGGTPKAGAKYELILNNVSQGDFASPKTFTGLAAGSYTVKVVDANGCFDTDIIEVGQPTAVADTLAKADASCNAGVDGSVTATFS